MESSYIHIGGQSIHYLTMGSGSRILLAFHGYSNSARLFLPFQPYLKDYTILSVDLPHHGNCQWQGDKKLEIEELKQLVGALAKQHQAERISLLGYSIGGRVCLKILELFPSMIERMVLMAPDGLAINPLYYFVTNTTIGRSMFRSFTDNPKPYIKWIDRAKDRNWIDASRHKFAMQYVQSDQGRQFLHKVWSCMSLLIPDSKKVKKTINRFHIPVDIFMGRHDRLIPVSLGKNFKKGMDTVQLHILDKGHRIFEEDVIPLITKPFHH